MRLLIALLVVVLIMGGMQLYMQYRPVRRGSAAVVQEQQATGIYSISITLTFDAGPDPFALQTDDAPSVLVLFRGQELLRRTDTVPAGEPIEIADVPQIVQGQNEFFVRATPQNTSDPRARAIRVQVRDEVRVVAEQTLWSAPGEAVEGTVLLDVDRADEGDHHGESANVLPDRQSVASVNIQSFLQEASR